VRRALVLATLVAIAVASLDCQPLRTCKAGTVLLGVSFESVPATADTLVVMMMFNGSTLRAQGRHVPGQTQGTIELDFPNAYLANQSMTLTLTATADGALVGTGKLGPIALPSGCAALHLNVVGVGSGSDDGGSNSDGGGGDLASCDRDGGCKGGICGDGIVDPAAGEECDDFGGVDTADCNGSSAGPASCKKPRCGDGYVNAKAGEQCNTLGGADSATCNGSGAGAVACKLSACGDGYKNWASGEQCDNGSADSATCNGDSAAAVSASVACQPARCGDGYINRATSSPPGGEQCDNGPANSNTSTCLVGCWVPKCGDGFVETVPVVEVCDDNNTSACGQCYNPNGCTAAQGATIVSAQAATGTITSFNSDSFNDGDTFTLSDGSHTVTFEFASTTAFVGHVPIDINTATGTIDANLMACRICNAIKGSGLNISVSCGGCLCDDTDNRLTLTSSFFGLAGNVVITTTPSPPTGFKYLGMTGGRAADCGANVGCTQDNDCASHVCALNSSCPGGVACGACAMPSCGDTRQNGSETDVDCGGSCPGCSVHKRCFNNSDCASGLCDTRTGTNKTGTGTCK
jgi:hypothetical protein